MNAFVLSRRGAGWMLRVCVPTSSRRESTSASLSFPMFAPPSTRPPILSPLPRPNSLSQRAGAHAAVSTTQTASPRTSDLPPCSLFLHPHFPRKVPSPRQTNGQTIAHTRSLTPAPAPKWQINGSQSCSAPSHTQNEAISPEQAQRYQVPKRSPSAPWIFKSIWQLENQSCQFCQLNRISEFRFSGWSI